MKDIFEKDISKENKDGKSKLVSLVVPFFNEGEACDIFFKTIEPILSDLEYDYEIICVNDGSVDETLAKLLCARANDERIKVIDLSRNFGKEAALAAGLNYTKGDAVIPIDSDLQDPPELIPQMIERWKQGTDMVLAKRIDRSADSVSKRLTSSLFYKLIRKMSHIDIPDNVGDYRLIDRKIVNVVNKLGERARFNKGIFAWPGFSSCEIEYTRPERSAGDTKFKFTKLWKLALEGIFAFSSVPLKIWTYIGFFIAFLSLLFGSYTVVKTLIVGVDVPGYASLVTLLLFLNGINLIGVGILGEYIGRIFDEVKQRPLYVVQSLHGILSDEKSS